jgi:hypothetical protein
MDAFTNFPDDFPKDAKRYLDEPHPSLTDAVSPFKEGKGSFSTGWWLAFHHYNRDLPQYKNIRQDIICCNLCGAAVKRGERARATSALVQHLKTKIHRTVFDHLVVLWEGKARDPLVPRTPKTPRTPRVPGTSAATLSRTKKGEAKAEKLQLRAMARWVADTNQPLTVVGTESFRNMVATLQATARFTVKANASAVAAQVAALDVEVKEGNKAMLAGRQVWTTQGYGGGSSSGYAFLTAHFITPSFTVAALMLEAKEGRAADKAGSTLASEYLEDTTAWGMKAGQTYAPPATHVSNPGFVSSTEATSATMGAQLEKNKGLLNMFFMDQKLASTAKVALSFSFGSDKDGSALDTTAVLTKARALVTLFLTSSQRMADVKKMQEDLPGEYKKGTPLGVVEDQTDFWWTAHDMIERLLKLRPALEKLWQEDRELDAAMMLDAAEWDVLKQLLIVLKPLIMGVTALKVKSVTAPLALVALNMVRAELTEIMSVCEGGEEETSDHEALIFAPTVSKCVKALLEDFDKTWGSLEEPFQGLKARTSGRSKQKGLHWCVVLAYALDPRFKALPHIPVEANKDAIWETIIKEMASAKKQIAESGAAAAAKSEGGEDGKTEDAMMLYMMNKAKGRRGGAKPSGEEMDQELRDDCTKELDAYKAEDSPPLVDSATGVATNPLDWWKANHTRFPALWAMAELYLAIPMSAASLEKNFGSAVTSSDEGAVELAKERMNIRCNFIDPVVVPAAAPPAAAAEPVVVSV